MNRRTLLGTASASLAGAVAGCLELGGDDIGYQRCDAAFVPFSELPSRASTEVETALEEGQYTTRRTLVYPELLEDDATLWDESENRYYEHELEVDDALVGPEESTLTFEEVTPSVDSTGDLLVSNQTPDELEVSVTIATADGDPVLTETVHAAPAEEIDAVDAIEPGANPGDPEDAQTLPGVAFPTEFGDYEVTIDVDDRSETELVSVTPWFAYYWVQVTEDDLLVGVIRERDEFFAEAITSKAGVHAACHQPPDGWPPAEGW